MLNVGNSGHYVIIIITKWSHFIKPINTINNDDEIPQKEYKSYSTFLLRGVIMIEKLPVLHDTTQDPDKYSDKQAITNSADPDQMSFLKKQMDLGSHCHFHHISR